MNDKQIIAHLRDTLFDERQRSAELRLELQLEKELAAPIGHVFAREAGELVGGKSGSDTTPSGPSAREAGKLAGGGGIHYNDRVKGGHYRLLCTDCAKVMSQCRCPGPKIDTYSTCTSCVLKADAKIKYERMLGDCWDHFCDVQKSVVTIYGKVCSYCDTAKNSIKDAQAKSGAYWRDKDAQAKSDAYWRDKDNG